MTDEDAKPDEIDHNRGLVPHGRVAPHAAVETAIAIAGSSAQGRVQLFPGDVDFFERAHIHAQDEDEAHRILREVLRETALRARAERDIMLLALDLGAYSEPVTRGGRDRKS